MIIIPDDFPLKFLCRQSLCSNVKIQIAYCIIWIALSKSPWKVMQVIWVTSGFFWIELVYWYYVMLSYHISVISNFEGLVFKFFGVICQFGGHHCSRLSMKHVRSPIALTCNWCSVNLFVTNLYCFAILLCWLVSYV